MNTIDRYESQIWQTWRVAGALDAHTWRHDVVTSDVDSGSGAEGRARAVAGWRGTLGQGTEPTAV